MSRSLVVEGTDGDFNQTMTMTGVKPKFGFGRVSDFSVPIEQAAQHSQAPP